MKTTYSTQEIKNAAKNLVISYGLGIRKHDVRLSIKLNHKTKELNDIEREKIVNRIWLYIKNNPVLV